MGLQTRLNVGFRGDSLRLIERKDMMEAHVRGSVTGVAECVAFSTHYTLDQIACDILFHVMLAQASISAVFGGATSVCEAMDYASLNHIHKQFQTLTFVRVTLMLRVSRGRICPWECHRRGRLRHTVSRHAGAGQHLSRVYQRNERMRSYGLRFAKSHP
jgi:hypothetical protein